MKEEDLVYFNPFADTEKSANRLPHWQQAGATYFITYRLADESGRVIGSAGEMGTGMSPLLESSITTQEQ